MILAKTVKGYGLGEGGEGRNATHQQKKLTGPQIQYFFKRFDMNIPAEKVKKLEFTGRLRTARSEYIRERQKRWADRCRCAKFVHFEFKLPTLERLSMSRSAGSGGRAASTTSAFVGVH